MTNFDNMSQRMRECNEPNPQTPIYCIGFQNKYFLEELLMDGRIVLLSV